MPAPPQLPVTSLEEAIERVYGLSVNVIGAGAQRHERPHKPLLLLAALDSISAGNATPQRVAWSNDLRNRFRKYFEVVRQLNDQNTPENPFLYLRGDDLWQPLE